MAETIMPYNLGKKRVIMTQLVPNDAFLYQMLWGKRVYLASPYSSNLELVVKDRVAAAKYVTEQLLSRHINVFSPIVYSTSIPNALSYTGWMAFDTSWLALCDVCLVLMLPGWEESKGIEEEIAFAQARNIPVYYINAIFSVED